MKKIILYLLVIIVMIYSSLCFASSEKRSAIQYTNLKIANVLLFHGKYDIELLVYCRQNIGNNTVLISKVEESLYKKLSEVSSIAPSLEELGGTPINVIASVINYRNNYKLLYAGPYRNQVVDNYLQIITDSLIEQKDKYGRLPTTPLIEFYKHYKQSDLK